MVIICLIASNFILSSLVFFSLFAIYSFYFKIQENEEMEKFRHFNSISFLYFQLQLIRNSRTSNGTDVIFDVFRFRNSELEAWSSESICPSVNPDTWMWFARIREDRYYPLLRQSFHNNQFLIFFSSYVSQTVFVSKVNIIF